MEVSAAGAEPAVWALAAGSEPRTVSGPAAAATAAVKSRLRDTRPTVVWRERTGSLLVRSRPVRDPSVLDPASPPPVKRRSGRGQGRSVTPDRWAEGPFAGLRVVPDRRGADHT